MNFYLLCTCMRARGGGEKSEWLGKKNSMMAGKDLSEAMGPKRRGPREPQRGRQEDDALTASGPASVSSWAFLHAVGPGPSGTSHDRCLGVCQVGPTRPSIQTVARILVLKQASKKKNLS
jgi:hypothetical protein